MDMAPQVVALLLRKIEDEWRALPPPQRPRAVWIALHEPLPESADDARVPRGSRLWTARRPASTAAGSPLDHL